MSEGAHQREPVPEAGETLLALEKLLADPNFCLSDRNRRFLSFVVTRSICGLTDRIKGYTIGVDVFGRSETFDADNDPIVRVEATRIRAALASYYGGPGAAATIRFALPKGKYVPVFYWAETPDRDSNATEPSEIRIIIENLTSRNDKELAALSDIYLETIVALLKRESLRIWISPPPKRKSVADAFQAMYLAPQHTCALDIALRPMQAAQRYSWRLSSLETAEILSNGFFDRTARHSDDQATVDRFIGKAVAEIVSTLLKHRTGPLPGLLSAEIIRRSAGSSQVLSSADNPMLPRR